MISLYLNNREVFANDGPCVAFVRCSSAVRCSVFLRELAGLHARRSVKPSNKNRGTYVKLMGVESRNATQSFKKRGGQYIDLRFSAAASYALTIEQNLRFFGLFFGRNLLRFAAARYFQMSPNAFDKRADEATHAERALLELTPLFVATAPLWIIDGVPGSNPRDSSYIQERLCHLFETKAFQGKGCILYSTTNNLPLPTRAKDHAIIDINNT